MPNGHPGSIAHWSMLQLLLVLGRKGPAALLPQGAGPKGGSLAQTPEAQYHFDWRVVVQ